ncbi:MAG: SDR family oxidoreductase [Burkholderiaceae bacterium]
MTVLETDWQSKKVIVSAGASGIGLAIATAFLNRGAKVAVCDISSSAIEEASSLHPNLKAITADVADRKSMLQFVEDAASFLGGVDTLVNNAGVSGPTCALEDISQEDWEKVLKINLSGPIWLAQGVVPLMKKQGSGSIINISSIAGRIGVAYRLPYSTTKFGVVGMTKSMAAELGEYGISVNAVLPGFVEGPRIDRVIDERAGKLGVSSEEMKQLLLKPVSMRTMVTADEIAAMVVYLASTAGRHISGQEISVCGGVQGVGA